MITLSFLVHAWIYAVTKLTLCIWSSRWILFVFACCVAQLLPLAGDTIYYLPNTGTFLCAGEFPFFSPSYVNTSDGGASLWRCTGSPRYLVPLIMRWIVLPPVGGWQREERRPQYQHSPTTRHQQQKQLGKYRCYHVFLALTSVTLDWPSLGGDVSSRPLG